MISSCIFPTDERSETLCETIIDTIKDKSLLLDKWIQVHESRYGSGTHTIPSSCQVSLAKLGIGGGGTMTDNCNAAIALGRVLSDQIRQLALDKIREDGGDESAVLMLQQNCHHHMRNVWFGAVVKRLSSYLNELLACDLAAISFRYRVSTLMDSVLRAVDKEFSLPANYPKGHGAQFRYWLGEYHPGALLVPVLRSAGSRQDMAVEGAAAVYWNRRYYIEFLNECLKSHQDNILQNNLFIILTSMEMISQFRVFAILHFCICLPMRWLAGNTHHLGNQGYDWSYRSMGKAIDALHDAMVIIESDGAKMLDMDFMDAIFSRIYNDEPLEPLTEYMTHMFGEYYAWQFLLSILHSNEIFISTLIQEERTGESLDGSQVIPLDILKAELFYPKRTENIETDDMVKKMAVEVASCLLIELRDPKKITSSYLSSSDGEFSWGQTSDDDHVAGIGMMATNDPAESPFAALTQQIQSYGRIMGSHASAVGHARLHGDFDRGKINGLYHQLPENMRSSLLELALRMSTEMRRSERKALEKQREEKQRRQETLRQKKLVAAQSEYADALIFLEMFHSPACWRTVREIHRNFNELGSDTAQREAMKTQIRIRVIGLGWKDLGHAWSKNGYVYSGEELRDHLIEIILPEERRRTIPSTPPVVLPSRVDRGKLGRLSADCELLKKHDDAEREMVVTGGKKMRRELEDVGSEEREAKMQPPRPSVDESLIDQKVKQLWDFVEPDGTVVPMWCHGLVVAVKTNSRVHIRWDDEYVRRGEPNITEERLLVKKWNRAVEGGWRMVLSD